jgi:hypothetical protein
MKQEGKRMTMPCKDCLVKAMCLNKREINCEKLYTWLLGHYMYVEEFLEWFDTQGRRIILQSTYFTLEYYHHHKGKNYIMAFKRDLDGISSTTSLKTYINYFLNNPDQIVYSETMWRKNIMKPYGIIEIL